MPTPTTYTYSKANDFPGGSVNIGKLTSEIASSSIVTALDNISGEDDVFNITFKDVLSTADKTTLDGDVTGPAGGLIAAHDNTPSQDVQAVKLYSQAGVATPVKFDAFGNIKFVPEIRGGYKFNSISYNFCDKTTWYSKSTKVTTETLSDSGDGLTFDSTHGYWIDLTHGKVTFEDSIVAAASGDYVPVVTVNDVAKVEGVDFTVNYVTGAITFGSSQSGNTVKATYWYAGSSFFVVKPPAGKTIELTRVEVQFSKDLILNDTMVFLIKGYAGVFAPAYVPVPYAFTDLIQLGESLKYKNVKDYLNESNGAYPVIPAFGGVSRGIQNDVITFPWSYLTKTVISSAAGMQIECGMENHTPHTGEFATITLYSIQEDDV